MNNAGKPSIDRSISMNETNDNSVYFKDETLYASVTSMSSIYKHSKEIISFLKNSPRYKQYQRTFNTLVTFRVFWLLISIGIELVVSFPFNWMMTSLEHRNSKEFYNSCTYYAIIAFIAAPILSLDFYLNQKVYIKFRELSTSILLEKYHTNHTYYYLASKPEIDNPGQRLDIDVDNWTWGVVGFCLIIARQFITLLGWSFILYHVGATMIFWGFIIAILVVIIGITIFASKLNQIAWLISKHSAEFRAGVIRTRDNCETIAFYSAAKFELKWSLRRLLLIINDTIMQAQWRAGVEYLRKITEYTGTVLPLILLASMYMNHSIELGGIMQSCYAFRQLIMSLTIIVNELYRLSNIQASGQRIVQVIRAFKQINETNINPPTINANICTPRMVKSSSETPDISITISGATESTKQYTGINCNYIDTTKTSTNNDYGIVLSVKNLSVLIPNTNTLLLQNFNLTMLQNQNILIVGPSGCGKSSLLRVLSGLWKSGCGDIKRLSQKELLFLPQKPYLPMLSKKKNTLKNQLLFPGSAANDSKIELSNEKCDEILKTINMQYLSSNNPCTDWNTLLSLGEQQRLGFGRLLVTKPTMAILDESTSALDVQNQAMMYQLLKNSGVSYLSVGHRTTLVDFHDIIIEVIGDGSWNISTKEQYLSQYNTTQT